MKSLMELAEDVKGSLNWDFLIHAKWELSPVVDDYFLNTIWATSTIILPHLEVQVVVDDNNKIHVSKGTSGFVSFEINPVGMKLPIKCWIHTHPFGEAYLSSTDWRTVNTWQPMMKSAIVLGDNQYLAVNMNNAQYEEGVFSAKKVFYGLLQQTVFDDIEPTTGGEE